MKPAWIRAAQYAGIDPCAIQIDKMARYADWLASEAREAGGIGPDESERIDLRHLADSLLFASQLPRDTREVWDLGSGVGLPGIPLAINLPETKFLLIDRSGRRCDLMRRAIRVLDLQNCDVEQRDITALRGRTSAIVSRASLPPEELVPLVLSHLAEGGTAVAAGSWQSPPLIAGWETKEIPSHVLDQPVWLLIMRRE